MTDFVAKFRDAFKKDGYKIDHYQYWRKEEEGYLAVRKKINDQINEFVIYIFWEVYERNTNLDAYPEELIQEKREKYKYPSLTIETWLKKNDYTILKRGLVEAEISGEKDIAGNLASYTSGEPPYMEARDDDGALHRLWQCDDPEKTKMIVSEMADKPVFIADGHHRYETAFEFHREMSGKRTGGEGVKPYDYVLMFLVNMADEGLTILPTHRLIKEMPDDIIQSLSEYFEMEEVRGNFDIAQRLSGKTRAFGFFREGRDIWHILTYKGGDLSEVSPHLRDIDVFILHELIIKKIFHTTDIGYEMDVGEALGKVRRGEFNAAFFLNPTRVEDVETAARSSMRMPPKSTYFYPKLLTGLVLHKWETPGDTDGE